MLYLILVATCLGVAVEANMGNQFLDTLLVANLPGNLASHGLLPHVAPDFSTSIRTKVAFINVRLNTNYTKGAMNGMEVVRRVGDCSRPVFIKGVSTFNCTAEFPEIRLSYKGKAKFGKLPSSNIDARANITRAQIFLQVSWSNFYQLGQFKVNHLGKIESTFSGTTVFKKKLLRSPFESYVIAHLTNLLNGPFKAALVQAVYERTPKH